MTSSESPKGRRLYDITLESKKLGLVTKADCIIFDDSKKEAYPIQHKYAYKPEAVYRDRKSVV